MNYNRHIEKAIIFMEENLCNDISLEDISDKVHLSLFHFHRLFRVCSGYTLKEYLRKRRLSEAARCIVFQKANIKDIALQYKFESNEHFIRAFKKEFNLTPGSLRRKVNHFNYFPPLTEKIHLDMIKKKGIINMKPVIQERPEYKLVGMKCTTTLSENSIPMLWDEFMKRFKEVKNVSNLCIGVCPWTECVSFDNNTPFDYIAGVVVDEFIDIPEGMLTWTVPASKYAVFTHKGSLESLNETYKYIFCVWASETEFKIAEADQLEAYDERFKFGQPDSEFDILIPLKS